MRVITVITTKGILLKTVKISNYFKSRFSQRPQKITICGLQILVIWRISKLNTFINTVKTRLYVFVFFAVFWKFSFFILTTVIFETLKRRKKVLSRAPLEVISKSLHKFRERMKSLKF